MYRLDVYDTAGVLQYQIVDHLWLAYTKRVNSRGSLQFGYWGEAPLLSDIQDKWQVEVWRRTHEWQRDFVAVYRDLDWAQPDKARAVLYCRGLADILSWTICAYDAGTTNRTRFINQPAETIAKVLVQYNATPDGDTADGRDLDVPDDYPFNGVQIESDNGSGNQLDWFCARRNLLDTLQGITRVGGGDFCLEKTSPTEWEFQWHDGQLGTDRTATVLFAMDRGNMGNPRYSERRSEEKTVGIVGGEGEGSERDIVVRTGADYATGNHVELFINASDIRSKELGTDGLEDRGDDILDDNRATSEFDFDVLQIKSSQYGVHYFLGDLITAVNPVTGAELELKIKEVAVSYSSDGNESISVEME